MGRRKATERKTACCRARPEIERMATASGGLGVSGFYGYGVCCIVLLLYVRLFESETFFLVYDFKEQSDDKGCHAEACEHDEWSGVVELCGVGHSLVGGGEHLADEQGEEPQSDVLNPED